MSAPSSDPAVPPIFAQPWAVRMGFAVLVALTLVVGLVFLDNTQRSQLEASTETTAVGDTAFFSLPDPAPRAGPVAALDGRPLALTDARPVDLRDTHLRRVGRDAEHGFTIYELADSATPAELAKLGKGRVLLLKIAVNQYVAAQLQ